MFRSAFSEIGLVRMSGRDRASQPLPFYITRTNSYNSPSIAARDTGTRENASGCLGTLRGVFDGGIAYNPSLQRGMRQGGGHNGEGRADHRKYSKILDRRCR